MDKRWIIWENCREKRLQRLDLEAMFGDFILSPGRLTEVLSKKVTRSNVYFRKTALERGEWIGVVRLAVGRQN